MNTGKGYVSTTISGPQMLEIVSWVRSPFRSVRRLQPAWTLDPEPAEDEVIRPKSGSRMFAQQGGGDAGHHRRQVEDHPEEPQTANLLVQQDGEVVSRCVGVARL